MKKAILLAALAALISGYRMSACTNLLVGKAASTDGSTFITYSMDMYGYCAKLRIVPATDHRSGEKAKVINYERILNVKEDEQTLPRNALRLPKKMLI